MHRRSIADIYHRPSQRTISKVHRTFHYISDALANIRQTIASQFFSSELLVFNTIYAQNRKASGSITCIIIHFTIAVAKIPNGTEALYLIEC